MGDHSPPAALYNLRWDAQQSALLGSVSALLKEEVFVDTSIVADGQIFKAHRLLLCASSPFLKHVLQSVPCKHSVLLFPHINATDFKNVLRFIYEGEIKIKQGELKSFLQVAKLLKIKGMDFDMGEENECESTSRPQDERNNKDVSMSVNENHHQQHAFEDNYYSEISRVESTLPDGTTVSEDEQIVEDIDADEHSNMNNDPFDEEKDYTEIILDDDNEIEEDEAACTENDDDDEEFPLQPEVSFRETDEALAMSHPMSSGLEIKSIASMRASWNLPHSSSSSTNNNNLGTTNRNSSALRQGFGKSAATSQQQHTGKDGILLRMMREPLKSSAAAATPYSHQPPYLAHDSNLRKTKRYVQCRSCSKVLSSLSALKRHMEDVHCARIQGKCLICGRVYSSRNSLLTHVYSAHKKHHDYKAVARIIRESDFEKFANV